MARLLLAGAVLVVLAIGFFVWGGDDEPSKTKEPDSVATRPDEAPGAAARQSNDLPKRVAPPAPTRRRPVDHVPQAATERAPEAAAPPPVPVTSDSEPPPELPPGPETEMDPMEAEILAVRQLFKSKDYEAAAEAGVAVMETYPESFEAKKIGVLSLCAIGDIDRANAYTRQVRKKQDRRYLVRQCKRIGLELP
jgi:hypothetical protein